jgi:hypothetical protein
VSVWAGGAEEKARQPWNLPLRARLAIALVAALIVAGKFYLRLPIHVPGHSGVIWMALLIAGVGIVGRPWAGTLIGLLSGALATFFLPGKEGLLVGVKYLVPGVMVDILLPLMGRRLDRYIVAIVIGAAAHASKLAASYLMGLAAGISQDYLALGIGLAATLHVGFGALGGALGAVVLKLLRTAGVSVDLASGTRRRVAGDGPPREEAPS